MENQMAEVKIWDFWAKYYDKLWVQKLSLAPTRKRVISKISNLLNKEKQYTILDMGCGTGQLLVDMEKSFKDFDIKYEGIDISPKMVNLAKEKLPHMKINAISADDFEADKGSYDFIICTHSFPYYTDKKAILSKFNELLRPGGYLMLAQASQNNLFDAMVMFFVKFTTSKAKYPSVKEMKKIINQQFFMKELDQIKEKIYMSSIYLFVCQKPWN
jgi:2-polyprenyl-3-methyl-5-hydroxy-6-metoxy-1,4-benzoquinol methylase